MKITIQNRTMDFEGGIVPMGHRYYRVTIRKSDISPMVNNYPSAAEIPLAQLVADAGVDNVSWPYKNRDMTPDYKGARSVISRRVLSLG